MKSAALCKERIVARGALASLPQAMARHAMGARAVMVGDDITLGVAGEQLRATLPENTIIYTHSLGITPQATMAHVEAVTALVHEKQATCVLAVGAGTVNDVCKLAAERTNSPYISIATAASMNGYSSATASIKTAGIKTSYQGTPPAVILADIDIIAAAPRRLTRSGIGDTLCRSTVEADCLLSHHLFGTPYPREAFRQLRARETALIAQNKNFQQNMHDYVEILMHTLIDTGDWMARTGSSAIASQGEHMIAHTIEMLYDDTHRALHGETVAVTTLTMHRLQKKMLLGKVELRQMPINHAQCNNIFGIARGTELTSGYERKAIAAAEAATINQRLRNEWPAIKREILGVMAPGSLVERTFIHLGVGTTPESIHLEETRYQSAVACAHMTRNRFTFLDLAAMMGRRAQV